jgi:actin-related protein
MDMLKFLSTNNLFQVLGEKEEAVVLYLKDNVVYGGLSGEDKPRCVERNVEFSHCVDGVEKVSVFVDQPAREEDLILALEPFLRRITLQALKVSLAERKCVICLDLSASEVFRTAISRVVLEKMKCPGVLIVTSAIVSLLPLGLETALVVEFGQREVSFVPVVQGSIPLTSVLFSHLNDVDLDEVAAKCISLAPVDARLALVSHVLINGTAPEGFVEQLKAKLPPSLAPHLKLVSNSYATSLAWMGGSIVGAALQKKHGMDEKITKKGQSILQLGEIQ